jgi:hypothetical protein
LAKYYSAQIVITLVSDDCVFVLEQELRDLSVLMAGLEREKRDTAP